MADVVCHTQTVSQGRRNEIQEEAEEAQRMHKIRLKGSFRTTVSLAQKTLVQKGSRLKAPRKASPRKQTKKNLIGCLRGFACLFVCLFTTVT